MLSHPSSKSAKTLFFPRLFCSPPRSSAGSDLPHRILDKPFDAVMLPVVVPALGMCDIRVSARLKIREPLSDQMGGHQDGGSRPRPKASDGGSGPAQSKNDQCGWEPATVTDLRPVAPTVVDG